MRVICILVACATGAVAAGEDWYPSQHGEGDTLGAINHLSPDRVVDVFKVPMTPPPRRAA
ncbi:MAG: hypothetical protein J4F45_04545 [Pseudomonadales bacterium]|nr:hypothetical protein [Pseudomonadales bacterium]